MLNNLSQSALAFDRCSFSYVANKPVLHSVSFMLDNGSFTWIRGNSGAGKSTLMKLVYGALLPSNGQVFVFGQSWSALNEPARMLLRRRIGVVFQDFRLLMHLSVAENVGLPLYVQGMDKSKIRKNVDDLLDWVGLKDKGDLMPAALSGGERQRVAIARAVIAQPKILIADEPTGNVDPDIAKRLMYLFTELNKLGTTVVIATHDHSLIEATPAQELRLQHGKTLLVKHDDAQKPNLAKTG